MTKSNVKLAGKKIKKNIRFKENREDESEEEEEEEKKNVWSKWVTFLRKPWMAKENERKFKIKERTMENDSDCCLEMRNVCDYDNIESLEIEEIPVDSTQDVSNGLMKSPRNGMKSSLVESSYVDICSTRVQEMEGPELKDEELQYFDEVNMMMDQTEETERETLKETVSDEDLYVISKDINIEEKKRNSLTSALYVRRDTETVVDSAVFTELNFSNDFSGCEKSEEFRQNWTSLDKRKMRCNLIEERHEVEKKTFKTFSEPTWKEKRKIFYERKLQENLNDLFREFFSFEEKEITNYFEITKNETEEKQKSVFETTDSIFSTEQSAHFSEKDLSRRVSPEILVNIKPFKEYLSNDLVDFSNKRHIHNHQNLEEVKRKRCKRQKKRKVVKEEVETKKEKSSENYMYYCPVIRSKIQFTRKPIKSQEKTSQTLESKRSIKFKEKEESVEKSNKNTKDFLTENFEISRCPTKILQESIEDRKQINSEICAIWGICKTYDQPQKPVNTQKNWSIDELLDNFDDRDHDLVFQKNIKQFRKKIDFKTSLGTDYKNQAFREFVKNKPEVKNSEKPIFVQEIRRHTGKYFTESNVEYLAKILIRRKQENVRKMYCRVFLVLSRNQWICRPKGLRLEEHDVLVSRSHHEFKEIKNCREENFLTVIERKRPENEKSIVEEELVRQLQQLALTLKMMKNHLNVSKLLSLQESLFFQNFFKETNGKNLDFPTIFANSQYFSNTTDCIYFSENYVFGEESFEGQYQPTATTLKKTAANNLVRENNVVIPDEKTNETVLNIRWETAYKIMEYLSFEKREVLFILNFLVYDFIIMFWRGTAGNIIIKSSTKHLSCTHVCKSNNSIKNKVLCSSSEILRNSNNGPEKTERNSCLAETVNKNGEEKNIHQHLDGKELTKSWKPNLTKNCNPVETSFSKSFNSVKTFVETNVRGNSGEPQAIKHFKIQREFDQDSTIDDAVIAKNIDIILPQKLISNNLLGQEPFKLLLGYEDRKLEQSCNFVLESEKYRLFSTSSTLKGEENKERVVSVFLEEFPLIEMSESSEKTAANNLLKHKSNSSPTESILQQQRITRFQRFLKDCEKFEFFEGKRKKVFNDKTSEMRRTESALLESRNPKPVKERLFIDCIQNKENPDSEIKFRLPEELKNRNGVNFLNRRGKEDLEICQELNEKKPATDKKSNNFCERRERKKTYVLEDDGKRVRTEVLAALNTIKKEMGRGPGVGGGKRMSLVIMLSKK